MPSDWHLLVSMHRIAIQKTTSDLVCIYVVYGRGKTWTCAHSTLIESFSLQSHMVIFVMVEFKLFASF